MRCTEVGAVESSRFFVLSMMLRETYWDRADVEETGRFDALRRPDTIVRLPQLLVWERVMGDLRTRLDAWLDSPRPNPVDLELAEVSKDQSLLFRLHDLRGAHVLPRQYVDLKYRGCRTSTSVRIPVDQSCIRIFADGVAEVLSASRDE